MPEGTIMNPRIFELGLNTEATSLYLLMCGLQDIGIPLTLSNVRSKWNGDDEALLKAVEDLAGMNIIEAHLRDGDVNAGFRILENRHWCAH